MTNTHYSWVEKYRPSKLDDINSQSHVVNSLKNVIITKNIPHLIFYGPSGCGKTSTILSLAKELFGKHYAERIIELKSSDERGINVIRNKIKTYAKMSIKNIENAPPWKIIILDEADTLTTDSQFALRRIIEQYSNVTRFCIICNYHSKIIDPIMSRCSLFKFKPIKSEDIVEKLKYISSKENFVCGDAIINKIIKISRGDLRKAINLLQKCHNSFGEQINEELIDDISGYVPTNKLNKLMDFVMIKDIKNVNLYINELIGGGYSLVNQIILLHDYFVASNISSDKKSKILFKLAEIDHCLIKGCDEYIMFMKLVYFIMFNI